MKVILSVDSVKFPLTGIGRYTYELARQLQVNAEVELMLFWHEKFIPDLPVHVVDIGGKQNPAGVKHWLYGQLRKSPLAVDAYRVYMAFRSARSHSVLQQHRDAIFHGPNFYLPRFEGPSIATFHDLSVFTFAQYHPPERVRFMRPQLEHTLECASMLITDSDYTRHEIASYFGYPIEKIRAVPLACSAEFHPRNALETSPVLQRHGLTYGSYTLYTGTVEPRKNIDALLDAYAALPEAMRRQWPLVIAGYRGWQSEKLHERIKAAVAAGWAYYLGYVSNDDLPYLYAGARLFVFPSHYEGFGLPVLEAMASGVPVVCSNSSSLPEVVGDAALTCDHDDTDGLRQLISRGLEDANWRTSAVTGGLQRAAGFSWQKCAAETIQVYRELNTGK
jgi:alpha-1,3-rhamnosyl/mannosyltransferase